jgi:hypothetical protein
MNTTESVSHKRDPVAVAIEKYLRFVEKDGVHKLSVKKRTDGIRLRFADQTTEGATLDIALVRLAALLLGHEALRGPLVKALRGLAATGPLTLEQVDHGARATLRCRLDRTVDKGGDFRLRPNLLFIGAARFVDRGQQSFHGLCHVLVPACCSRRRLEDCRRCRLSRRDAR